MRLLRLGLLSIALVHGYQSALNRGKQAYDKNDFALAESAFRQAVKEEPRSAQAHKFLGLTYATEEKFELAEAPLKQGCTLDPREDRACHYLGMNYLALSRYEEARKAFETSLRFDPKHRGRALLGMAIYEEAVANNAAAERNYKASIDAGNPGSAQRVRNFSVSNRPRPRKHSLSQESQCHQRTRPRDALA